jgi:hypothetical protein
VGVRLDDAIAVTHCHCRSVAAYAKHSQIADYERLTPGVLQCTPGTQMLQFCVSHHRAGALIAA